MKNISSKELVRNRIKKICKKNNISTKITNNEDVVKLKENLTDVLNINSSLSSSDIEMFCNIEMGTQLESRTISRYEEDNNVKLQRTGEYVKKKFYETNSYNFYIGGRVDASVEGDEKKIIEVKNRNKEMVPHIPLHDIIQLCSYMYIHDIHNGAIVEQHGDVVRNTDFTYLNGFETHVLDTLKSFSSFIVDFINSKELRHRLAKCSQSNDENEIKKMNSLIIDKLNIRHNFTANKTDIKNKICTVK